MSFLQQYINLGRLIFITVQLFCLVGFATMQETNSETNECPNGWRKIRNRCYNVINTKVTWEKALASCQSMEATLLTLDFPTVAEANGVLRQLDLRQSDYWVGITSDDFENDESLRWINNAPVQEINWNADDCPDGWLRRRSRCYKKFDERATWVAAQANCENMDGSLVVLDFPRTQESNSVLFTLDLQDSLYWVGLYNDAFATTRNLTWINGATTEITNWIKGQPDANNTRHCLLVTGSPTIFGQWNASWCNRYRFFYMCQRNRRLREENCLVVNAGAVLTSDFGKLRDASCDCEEQFYVCQRDIGNQAISPSSAPPVFCPRTTCSSSRLKISRFNCTNGRNVESRCSILCNGNNGVIGDRSIECVANEDPENFCRIPKWKAAAEDSNGNFDCLAGEENVDFCNVPTESPPIIPYCIEGIESSTTEPDDGCPFPWVRIGNRTYRKILRKATWVEALETCRDVGGTLMTLDFPTIQQADDLLRNLSLPIDHYWVGLTADKFTSNSTLTWINGQTVEETNWNSVRCPNEWIVINNRCYKKVDELVTWVTAKSRCETMGGTLMTLDFPSHPQANDVLYQLPLQEAYYWVGLQDDNLLEGLENGNFTWVNGKPVTYVNWAPNHPGSNRNCLRIRALNTEFGLWYSHVCQSPDLISFYICQREPGPYQITGDCLLANTATNYFGTWHDEECADEHRLFPFVCQRDPNFQLGTPPPALTCVRKACHMPVVENPESGYFTCSSDAREVGSTCTITCNPFYGVDGAKTIECISGKETASTSGLCVLPRWTDIPSCRALFCPTPPVLRDGAMSCTRDFLIGSICSFSCPGEGFALSQPGYGGILCYKNSTWIGLPLPRCNQPISFVYSDRFPENPDSVRVTATVNSLVTSLELRRIKRFFVDIDISSITLRVVDDSSDGTTRLTTKYLTAALDGLDLSGFTFYDVYISPVIGNKVLSTESSFFVQ